MTVEKLAEIVNACHMSIEVLRKSAAIQPNLQTKRRLLLTVAHLDRVRVLATERLRRGQRPSG